MMAIFLNSIRMRLYRRNGMMLHDLSGPVNALRLDFAETMRKKHDSICSRALVLSCCCALVLSSRHMKMLTFPELRQTYDYDCGPKSVQAVLAYYGIDVREAPIMKLAGTSRSGTPIRGIVRALRKYGLKYKVGKMDIAGIKRELDRNRPVILVLQAWATKEVVNWEKDWIDGHYVVAIGYDARRIFFEDPSSVMRTYLTYDELMARWHDVDTEGRRYFNYGIVAYGRKPEFDLDRRIHMD